MSRTSSKLYGLPRTGEENKARVLVETFSSISSIFQFRSEKSISTKTGLRPF
jgi:hypothetical protein